MDSVRLSVTFITLNESHQLERSLRSVSWADDVVVLDSGSTDGTPELARRLGARVTEIPVRHHARSAKFFYGMLAAQAAVIISTFSLAAKKRSMLWSVAAAAGLAAIAFAVYVYLCV